MTQGNNKESKLELEGRIIDALPGSEYLVEVQVGEIKHQLVAYLSGKMRKYFIRVGLNDLVKVEVSPDNWKLGRIVYKVDSRRMNQTAPSQTSV